MSSDSFDIPLTHTESYKSRTSKRLEFKCEANLGFGETLYVVGSNKKLGCWQRNSGVELSTSPDTFPIWHVTIEFHTNLYEKIDYKYCVFRGGAFYEWENLCGNRTVIQTTYHGHVCDVLGVGNPSGYVDDMSEDVESTLNESVLPTSLSSSDRLMIVTMFLPIKVQKDPNTHQWTFEWASLSILSLFLRELITNNNYKWVGVFRSNEIYSLEDQLGITAACHSHNCLPVFITPTDYQLHYEQYCKGYLWPIFHNILNIYGDYAKNVTPEKMESHYAAYKRVNKAVENVVKEHYHEGELIWVMDYQLMLVPFSLRRHLKPAKIGFVFYVPFPSSDVFSTIKDRKELITSLLSCDVISFESFSSGRHFGNMCHRYLKVIYRKSKEGYLEIEYNGQVIPILASHCGLEPNLYLKYGNKDDVPQYIAEIKTIAKNRQIIGSYETEERLKGIPYKLSALYDFFRSYPSYRKTVCVLMFLTCAPCRGDDYTTSLREIHTLVDRINKQYSPPGQQIIYLKEGPYFKIENRIALWTLSDLYFSTPLRDGLHLIALEYVYIRKTIGDPGVVIISELTGCARLLNGSIRVNPFRTAEIVLALEHVFHSMTPNERQLRQLKNEESFATNTAAQWTTMQLECLKHTDHGPGGVLVGFGLGTHIMHLRADFKHLHYEELRDKYINSKRRLILTDYGGTLITSSAESKLNPKAVEENEINHVRTILTKLSDNLNNTVFVTSGRLMSELKHSLGDIPGLALAAEHGYIYKLKENNVNEPWTRLITAEGDDGWKNLSYSIMSLFTNRTNGTSAAIKGCAVVWEYKNADPDYGPIQAKELCDVLRFELEQYQVNIILEDYYVEVRPQGVDKGTSTNHFINLLNSHGQQQIDFILAIGDDTADEPMFEVVNKYSNLHPQVNCYTVTVGQRHSESEYFFYDVKDCLNVLENLGKTIGKIRSVTGLAAMLSNNPNDSLRINLNSVPRSLSAIFPKHVTTIDTEAFNPDCEQLPEVDAGDESDESVIFV